MLQRRDCVSATAGLTRSVWQGEDLAEVQTTVRRFPGRKFRVAVVDAQSRRAWSNPVWLA